MTITSTDSEHGVRTARLPSGEAIPSLGQGTWGIAEDARRRKDEIAALRAGFDLGMTLVDTAEMYADGGAEGLVGEAIAGRRDELFLVSKILPENATKPGKVAACEPIASISICCTGAATYHWRKRSMPLPLSSMPAKPNTVRATCSRFFWS